MTEIWNPQKIEHLETLLTARDGRILEDLEAMRALSTRQIQRLHLPAGEGGLHATQSTATRLTIRVLQRLEGHGFIARLQRRIGGSVRGSAATIWHLASAGERLLRARRGDPSRRRYGTPSRSFLSHTIAVAEVAVSVREQSALGAFELIELSGEPNCWRTFPGPGGVETVKPDLYVAVADDEVEVHAFLELDRGTEHLPTVLRKCLLYQRYRATGIEQTTLGTYPVVVWAVPDERRAALLRTAIRREPDLPDALFTVTTHEDVLRVLTSTLSPKGGTP